MTIRQALEQAEHQRLDPPGQPFLTGPGAPCSGNRSGRMTSAPATSGIRTASSTAKPSAA